MSDSKGAAIRDEVIEILSFFRAEATDQPYNIVRALKEKYAAQILAILAQEVKRKTILELKRLQAYGLNHEITTPIIEDRIKAIERLG